jgi:hypothetical protein
MMGGLLSAMQSGESEQQISEDSRHASRSGIAFPNQRGNRGGPQSWAGSGKSRKGQFVLTEAALRTRPASSFSEEGVVLPSKTGHLI